MNLYAQNLECMRDDYFRGGEFCFVSSYPRSGNTWMRYLISDVLLSRAGYVTGTDLPVHPDQVIPDMHSNDISERDSSIWNQEIIVKSHDAMEELTDRLGGDPDGRVRHIYLMRRPEDALVSYYHYHLRYPNLQHLAAGGADDFCYRFLPQWIYHIQSTISHYKSHGNVKYVLYENLLENPESVLTQVMDFIGVPDDRFSIKNAVSHMEFDNLRNREARNPVNNSEFFFRKGISGSGPGELSLEIVNIIRHQSHYLYEEISNIQYRQAVAAPVSSIATATAS